MAYIGSPRHLGQLMANPLSRRDGDVHQPIVAVLNIGTGNCNVVYDGRGRIVAYYDFGNPFTTQKKTAPLLQYAHCVHDDPLLILSHWDWDHYSMSRRVRTTWNLRWIAPQQHIGSAATREVYGRVLNSPDGGELYVWNAAAAGMAAPEHLRLPWGFLERGLTHHQLADNLHPNSDGEELNNGGLAMYVCVKDAPGETLRPLLPGGVHALGAVALAAAVADAATTVLALAAAGAPPWAIALIEGAALAAVEAVAGCPASRPPAPPPAPIGPAAAALAFALKVELVASAVAQQAGVYPTIAGNLVVADLVQSATAAVGAALARPGATWGDAMAAMAAAAAGGAAGGTVAQAAAGLCGWLTGLGALGAGSCAAAVVANGGGGAMVAALGLGGATPATLAATALAVAVADVAFRAEILGAAGPLVPIDQATVGLAALTGLLCAAAQLGIAAGGAAAPVLAVAGAVAALHLDAQVDAAAQCGAAALLRLPELQQPFVTAAHLGNLAPDIARAAAAAVSSGAARGAAAAIWARALEAEQAAGAAGGAITAHAVPLHNWLNGAGVLFPPGGATAALTIAGQVAQAAAAAQAPVSPRGGAVPPATLGRTVGTAAFAAAVQLRIREAINPIAQFADQAVVSYPGIGGAAPLVPDIARAATAAMCELAARGAGTWADALAGMIRIGGGVGAVSAAGVALHGALAGAGGLGLASAGAAITAHVGAPSHAMALAASIADAAVAMLPIALGGPPPWVLAPVGAVAHVTALAVAQVAAGGGLPVFAPGVPVNPAINAAVGATQIDLLVEVVAHVAGAAAAEAAHAAGALPALNPLHVAAAAVVALGTFAARAGGTTWQHALTALAGVGGAGGAVCAAAGPLLGAVAAAGSIAGSINANAGAVAPLVPGAAQVEVNAAVAAVVDGAAAAWASMAAVGAVVLVLPAGPNLEKTRAGAAVDPANDTRINVNAAAAASAAPRVASHGDAVQLREITWAARDAARQLALAANHGNPHNMHLVPAPLSPPAAPGVVVVHGPPAPGMPGVGLAGANALTLATGLVAGTGPFHPNERYVLVTGDVGPDYIPTLRAGGGPVVVAMTPSHHGADTCFTDAEDRARLPWAPGTPAATAGAAAQVVRAAGGGANVQRGAAATAFATAEAAIAAGLEPIGACLSLADVGQAALVVGGAAGNWVAMLGVVAGAGAVSHRGRIAALALAQLGGGGMLASVAAAVVGIGAGSTAASVVGVVAAESVEEAIAQAVATGVLAAGPAVTLPAVGAAIAAVQPGAGVIPALAGGAAGVNAALQAAAVAAVSAIVAHGTVNVPAPSQAAVVLLAIGLLALPANVARWRRAVIAVAGIAASVDAQIVLMPLPASPSALAALAARTAVNATLLDAAALLSLGPAIVQPPPRLVWPGPAAAFGPGVHASVPAATVLAAVEAEVHGYPAAAGLSGNAALAVAERTRSARIAYSYGVRLHNYVHYYGNPNFRHPHPEAVRAYEARGWTDRRNTSYNAWRSAQPDPWAGAPAAAFVAGDNVALGWESDPVAAFERAFAGDPGTPGRAQRKCTMCGAVHFVT